MSPVAQLSERVRWFFTDPTTGRVVIAQFPNWSLIGFLVFAGAGRVFDLAGLRWIGTAFLLIWSLDELLRGEAPWRRVLGLGVLVTIGVGVLM